MPKGSTLKERMLAVKANEQQTIDCGYVNVFQGGTRVKTANSREEFAQLKAELIADLEQGKFSNAYAKYTFADGSSLTLNRKSFCELESPEYGDRLNINL